MAVNGSQHMAQACVGEGKCVAAESERTHGNEGKRVVSTRYL